MNTTLFLIKFKEYNSIINKVYKNATPLLIKLCGHSCVARGDIG